ncbi:MAG: PIN domain-containing protein [Cyanobacteria bacterium J06649_11]
MANNVERVDALIFIDTNIFLDFYRIRNSDVSMSYLDQIIEHKDIVICGSQVEMEYKKNRQRVVISSIGEINNKLPTLNLGFPAIIADSQPTKMLEKYKKGIKDQKKRIKERVEKVLKNPSRNDQVYRALQKLWKNNSSYNLNRTNKQRFIIRELAQKRFMMGYPPRKKGDTSIGDAINWEWIIKCAEVSNKSIIIVSRDQDFGSHYGSESFIDDWLLQEFKERTSRKRKLVLTDKLSTAFRMVEIPVTQEMVNEEEEIIRNVSVHNVISNYLRTIDVLKRNTQLHLPDLSILDNRLQTNLSKIATLSEIMKRQSLGFALRSEEE